MIRFALRCSNSHQFESWFGSGTDFDRLQAAGLVSCAVCGDANIEKDLMAPGVSTRVSKKGALAAPASPAEKALGEMRRKIEASSENVGNKFAEEARKIHNGEAPERAIIGEARPAEAKALIDDGIRVLPLPWNKTRTN